MFDVNALILRKGVLYKVPKKTGFIVLKCTKVKMATDKGSSEVV